jgi:hypothetical protein
VQKNNSEVGIRNVASSEAGRAAGQAGSRSGGQPGRRAVGQAGTVMHIERNFGKVAISSLQFF